MKSFRLMGSGSVSAARSKLMRAVKQKNTAPELIVRRWLHAAGLRYRLHGRDLPGTPDLVLPRRRTVVFVHGCFWHGHDCRHGAAVPRRNTDYWTAKIHDNRRRDADKAARLKALGWRVEVIWECETRQVSRLLALSARLLRR
jgi:DNA mismatch endonuclease, patch repair protein